MTTFNASASRDPLTRHETDSGPASLAQMEDRPSLLRRKAKREQKETSTSYADYMSFPFKVVGSGGWAGNLPCVHGPKEGCSRHNPDKLPIAYNQRVPSSKKKPDYMELLFGPPEMPDHEEVQLSECVWSMLYLDNSIGDPLDPVHNSIPFNLAYYHLDWVRKAESPVAQMERAATLGCYGTVPRKGKLRPELKYWIHPAWYKDSFLVQQVVVFTFEPNKRHAVFGSERVFSKYKFTETRGLMKASVTYKTTRDTQIYPVHCRSTWRSEHGTHRLAWTCVNCCMDSCIEIKLVEDKIVVYLFVWKDLGNASTPFEREWIAALRTDGPRWRRSEDHMKNASVRMTVQEALREEINVAEEPHSEGSQSSQSSSGS
ncbi:hypothetical protein F4677DRAFT_443142 [Hypoxylon crocopeplum]|nr:hypothetical protein F4677DRAFT_443142 [Hypoxylon crocopeplum]